MRRTRWRTFCTGRLHWGDDLDGGTAEDFDGLVSGVSGDAGHPPMTAPHRRQKKGELRRTQPFSIFLLLLVLLGLASPLSAASLQVSLVSLSSPVARSGDATIQIQTNPGATCSITVHYKSDPSRAKGLVPQTADGKGRVTWRWRVGSNTTPGRWPIDVACRKGSDEGDLRTSFEVR